MQGLIYPLRSASDTPPVIQTPTSAKDYAHSRRKRAITTVDMGKAGPRWEEIQGGGPDESDQRPVRSPKGGSDVLSHNQRTLTGPSWASQTGRKERVKKEEGERALRKKQLDKKGGLGAGER